MRKTEQYTNKYVELGDNLKKYVKYYYEKANAHFKRKCVLRLHPNLKSYGETGIDTFSGPTEPTHFTQLIWHLKDRLGNLKDKKMLDIGCGYGVLMRLLWIYNADVYGADPNNKLIDYCWDNGFKLDKIKFAFAYELVHKFKKHIGTFWSEPLKVDK